MWFFCYISYLILWFALYCVQFDCTLNCTGIVFSFFVFCVLIFACIPHNATYPEFHRMRLQGTIYFIIVVINPTTGWLWFYICFILRLRVDTSMHVFLHLHLIPKNSSLSIVFQPLTEPSVIVGIKLSPTFPSSRFDLFPKLFTLYGLSYNFLIWHFFNTWDFYHPLVSLHPKGIQSYFLFCWGGEGLRSV